MSVLKHFVLWNLGLAGATTQTTAAERDCLARHATGRRRLAEIGVWHGVTTARLRAAMAEDGEIWAVDPYPPGRLGFSVQLRIARATVRRVPRGSVVWQRCTGVEAAARRRDSGAGPVDFIFIDGDHSYDGLRGDWEAWSPLVAPGGIVALHDSRPTPDRDIASAGSVRYTSEVVLRDPSFDRAETVDSLTVLRRHS
jgi:predicted O-methyltransferase YrrM